VFSVFHHIEIVVVSDTPRDSWYSAFDLGSLWALSSFRFMITKVLTLFLSPETLPYKVTFVGSRNRLGPVVFEGHHFHLHLTVHIRPVHKVRSPCSGIPRSVSSLQCQLKPTSDLDTICSTGSSLLLRIIRIRCGRDGARSIVTQNSSPSADLETRQVTCFQTTGVGQALEPGSRETGSKRENTEGRKEAADPSSFQI